MGEVTEAVRVLEERIAALQSERTRTRLILRRLLSMTAQDACRDPEAWAMAEEILEGPPPKLGPAVSSHDVRWIMGTRHG